MYKHIIDFVLKKELVQFREYWRQCKLPIDSTNVIQLFERFGKQSLEEIFSYIFTSLKIDLIIPVVYCPAK